MMKLLVKTPSGSARCMEIMSHASVAMIAEWAIFTYAQAFIPLEGLVQSTRYTYITVLREMTSDYVIIIVLFKVRQLLYIIMILA